MDDLMKQSSRDFSRVSSAVLSRRRIHAAALASCAALTLLITGCGGGGDVAHVQGAVTINGQPVPADAMGNVTFQPTESGKGRTVSAPLEGGHYDLPEVPVGSYRVTISIQKPNGKMIDNGRGAPAEDYDNLVSYDQAPVEATVEDDRDDLNFDVKGM
jgi:hypothetical protein